MSFGERLSAFIICEAFKDRGLSTEYLDARKVIRTDNQFGYAKVDFEVTHKLIRDHFKNHGDVQIITGFIATSESGETTTLGRSGSDYTAAIFAGALQASALEIWTDVDGMMTADPRLVKKAFTRPSDELRRSDGAFALRRESNFPIHHATGHGTSHSYLD